jgi:hypothetical protein
VKPGTVAAIVCLALVALAHLLRVALDTDVIVGGVAIPTWGSLAAFVVTGGIAFLLWQERRG